MALSPGRRHDDVEAREPNPTGGKRRRVSFRTARTNIQWGSWFMFGPADWVFELELLTIFHLANIIKAWCRVRDTSEYFAA